VIHIHEYHTTGIATPSVGGNDTKKLHYVRDKSNFMLELGIYLGFYGIRV
jgi:hypothetical protein